MSTGYERHAEDVLHSRILHQLWPSLTTADMVQIAIRLITWEMKTGRMYPFEVMRQFAEEQVRMRRCDK